MRTPVPLGVTYGCHPGLTLVFGVEAIRRFARVTRRQQEDHGDGAHREQQSTDDLGKRDETGFDHDEPPYRGSSGGQLQKIVRLAPAGDLPADFPASRPPRGTARRLAPALFAGFLADFL